jgi:membrane protease subunit (stomatin/prohibitin family)
MAENIEFVRDYSDQSTDQGFQFEFQCDRCSSGFRTPFRPAAAATVTSVLDAASSLLGGVFGRAADISERVRSASWQQARDKAFAEALEELKPEFAQCPHCSSWVCRKSCWHEQRGLCKSCAPDMGVEMSAAQASRSREEVWAHAKMSAEDKKLSESNWRETIVASCPKCNAPLATNAKFCPACGEKLQGGAFCAQCGAKLQPEAKFCAECGAKTEP